MLSKALQLLSLMIILFSCNSFKHENIVWKKKTPLGVHYFIKTNEGNIYGLEAGKGYFSIDSNGKIASKTIFEDKDIRRTLSNIKVFTGNNVYGIYSADNIIYIAEVLKGINLKSLVTVSSENIGKTDFLISADGTRYCGFNEGESSMGEEPHEWIDIKTGRSIDYFSPFSIGNDRTYFVNNKFYSDGGPFMTVFRYTKAKREIRYYDSSKIDSKFYSDDFGVPENYYSIGKFEKKIISIDYESNALNSFIIGEDGYFYLSLNNFEDGKSWSYYLLKLDKELNLIGKRRVDLKEDYDDRCTSSIFVDEDGFIYVASDKEMTITKFKPIEDGEDSLVDLRG